jgi:glycerol kinase
MTPLLLAVDQGTTNTKALLVDRAGQTVFRVSEPVTLISNEQELIEQNPLELWNSVQRVAARASDHARQGGGSIEGVAITNQRETALAWHRESGNPLAPAISWQCRRSAGVCRGVAEHSTLIRRSTGLPLDPVLSATKWAWMLENVPAVREAASTGNLCFGTVDSWLLFKLTNGRLHMTDTTNASRTGLLDLRLLQWSPELTKLFAIPLASLATIVSSSQYCGTIQSIPELTGVPIVAAIGDSHGALAGHGSFGSGTVKATYGTGSSLMTLTETLVDDTPQLARTVAWSIGERTQFALEGNIFMSGSALQWVGEFLGLEQPAEDAAKLAETVTDSAGVYFVPAMVGLGAPYWDAAARGIVCGLGRVHTAAHLARAAIEAICYQVSDVLLAMERSMNIQVQELQADGGATRNRSLMQSQADILGRPVVRACDEELSALGAAYLGGIALGWWTSMQSVSKLARTSETFSPSMPQTTRDLRYREWQEAVRCSRSLRDTTA